MISGIAALMLTGLLAQTAPADLPPSGTLAGAGSKPVEILWPVPYYVRAGKEMTPNSRRLEQLLGQVGVPHHFSFTPVKRAFHLYAATEAGCTPHGREPLLAGDLISQPFASTAQWFYVRAADGIRSVDEIRTAAALEGVKRFFDPKGYERITWQYAPAYPALVAMLSNGRVQAVALGSVVENGIVKLPDGVVRLEGKPFVSMELRLHCKPTPEARLLIDRLDAAVLAGGR